MIFLTNGLREKRAHDVLQRGAIVSGHPVRELEEASRYQWIRVDEGFERTEVELHDLWFVNSEDGARGRAIAQWHPHPVAGHNREPLGDCVVEDEFGRTVDEDLGGGHLVDD